MRNREICALAGTILGAATIYASTASAKAVCKVADDHMVADGGMDPVPPGDVDCDGGAGGGDPPPPPPWVPPPQPEPEPNPECECDLKDSTEKTGPFQLPQMGQNFPAEKLLGPGQSIGFFVTGSYEKTTAKSPCACFEKSDSSTALAGSIQVGKNGGMIAGRFTKSEVACSTPECPEGGDFACVAPTGSRKTDDWSASGGINFQIPWEAVAPTICGPRIVQCNGEIGITLHAAGGSDVAAGKGYCAGCAEGLDLHHFSVGGSIALRGEIELNVWLASATVGVMGEGGIRYREYAGNNCGTAVNKSDTCVWANAKIYGNACVAFFCIDGERELFSFGNDCKNNVPPAGP